MSRLRRRQRVTRGVQRRKVVGQGRSRTAKAQLQAAELPSTTLDLSRRTYLTYPQAADYLGVTVRALKRRVQRESVPPWCWTKFGGSVRFIRESLDQLLHKQERLEMARAHETHARSVSEAHK